MHLIVVSFDSFFEKLKIIFVVMQCFSDKSMYLLNAPLQ